MATSIVLASQKGGVGKTTVSLNLAVVLAESGRKTVLLDLDPQGAIGLSLARDETEWKGVAELLMKQGSLDDVLVQTKVPALQILGRGCLDPCNVIEYERVMATRGFIAELLDDLGRRAEFIVIDTPSGLGAVTRAALGSADYVLVPFQAESLALRSVSQVLRVIEHVRDQENPRLNLLGILPTMVDLGNDNSLNVMGTMWAGFGGVLDTMIPRADVFASASRLGLPLGFLAGPKTSEARRFDMLMSELDNRLAEAKEGERDGRPQRELL